MDLPGVEFLFPVSWTLNASFIAEYVRPEVFL